MRCSRGSAAHTLRNVTTTAPEPREEQRRLALPFLAVAVLSPRISQQMSAAPIEHVGEPVAEASAGTGISTRRGKMCSA
jgi:hypothetical protein